MEKTSRTWPLSLRGCPPPERSHKVILLSLPADSTVWPSGVNPTAFTIPIEPCGRASLRGENSFGSLAESQAITSPPVPAEMSRFVFGENAMAHTQPVCPPSVSRGGSSKGASRFDRSQRLIGGLKPEAAKVFPS